MFGVSRSTKFILVSTGVCRRYAYKEPLNKVDTGYKNHILGNGSVLLQWEPLNREINGIFC